jgi:hypothetical protein
MVLPKWPLSPYLLSVSAIEAIASGVKVVRHPYKDRQWALDNASIPATTDMLLQQYSSIGVE